MTKKQLDNLYNMDEVTRFDYNNSLLIIEPGAKKILYEAAGDYPSFKESLDNMILQHVKFVDNETELDNDAVSFKEQDE